MVWMASAWLLQTGTYSVAGELNHLHIQSLNRVSYIHNTGPVTWLNDHFKGVREGEKPLWTQASGKLSGK